MSSKINFWHRPSTRIYLAAIQETVFIVFVTMLPIVTGSLYFLISDAYTGLKPFYTKGEFFLYSLSLLVSSNLVFNQYKLKSWDWYSAFSKFTLVAIIVASSLHSLIANAQRINNGMLQLFSIIIITIAIGVYYYSQVVSNRHAPDVAKIRRDEQQDIEDSLS